MFERLDQLKDVLGLRHNQWRHDEVFEFDPDTGGEVRIDRFYRHNAHDLVAAATIHRKVDAPLMDERFLAHAQASLRFFSTCTVEAALLSV